MKLYCYLNGDILPLDEAKISIMDIGILRGYSVYDGMAVINGKVLRFSDHWQRFIQGAGAFKFKNSYHRRLTGEKNNRDNGEVGPFNTSKYQIDSHGGTDTWRY